jgi:hypothetical protein
VTVDGTSVMIELFDSTGEELSGLAQDYIKKCSGYILVYSVASRESFAALEAWRDRVLQQRALPFIVVGSKSDVDAREVRFEEGLELARQWRTAFVEVSAKTAANCSQMIEHLRGLRGSRVAPSPAGGRGGPLSEVCPLAARRPRRRILSDAARTTGRCARAHQHARVAPAAGGGVHPC